MRNSITELFIFNNQLWEIYQHFDMEYNGWHFAVDADAGSSKNLYF